MDAEALDSTDLCGLDGDENAPPPRKEINRFVARALHGHVRPLKASVKGVADRLDAHCDKVDAHMAEYAAFKNQLAGAKWALYFITGLLVAGIPLAWQILKALNLLIKVGV